MKINKQKRYWIQATSSKVNKRFFVVAEKLNSLDMHIHIFLSDEGYNPLLFKIEILAIEEIEE